MPESITSLPEVRCSALEEFVRKRAAPESSKTQYCHGRSRTPSIRISGKHLKARRSEADVQPFPTSNENGRSTKTRGRGARTNPIESITANDEPPPQPPSRKPGSSIYYGVRFRPDLNKWVAEIRVAEWKAVDKKVWLGTFDTERGAARGVDLARKLLKCKKKHRYNLPCSTLDSYSGQIPTNLVLTDVTTNSMFKAATLFIKRECQDYAASFDDSPNSDLTAIAITPDHHFQAQAPSITHMVSQTNSVDSEILDEVVNEYSDSESRLMPEYCELESMISVDDYLNDDYLNDGFSFDQVAVSQSSSCTSATSCVTFDQPCLDVTECEMSSAAPVAGFGKGGSVMATTMMPGGVQGGIEGGLQGGVHGGIEGGLQGGTQGGVQGGIQGGVQGSIQGAVSQECWVHQYRTWPGPGSSSALAPLPGSYYTRMTSYLSYVDGVHNPSIDYDDLSFQGVHYPFQHGSNEWY